MISRRSLFVFLAAAPVAAIATVTGIAEASAHSANIAKLIEIGHEWDRQFVMSSEAARRLMLDPSQRTSSAKSKSIP